MQQNTKKISKSTTTKEAKLSLLFACSTTYDDDEDDMMQRKLYTLHPSSYLDLFSTTHQPKSQTKSEEWNLPLDTVSFRHSPL